MNDQTTTPEAENSEKTSDEADLSAATCYALVLYSYDYFEWEETFAVSFDAEKLKSEYDALDHLFSYCPLVTKEEHETWKCREEEHWVIEPVKYLA